MLIGTIRLSQPDKMHQNTYKSSKITGFCTGRWTITPSQDPTPTSTLKLQTSPLYQGFNSVQKNQQKQYNTFEKNSLQFLSRFSFNLQRKTNINKISLALCYTSAHQVSLLTCAQQFVTNQLGELNSTNSGTKRNLLLSATLAKTSTNSYGNQQTRCSKMTLSQH